MFDRYKDAIIRLLLWTLLISSLVATITNLAWAFGVLAPNGSRAAWFGAISFDGAVLIISFYARRFKAGTYPRHLARGIVITNTAISIYANVYRAIEYQVALTRITGAAWNSMPIVLGLALPLLTLALAEILVMDEEQRSQIFEKELRKQAKTQLGQVAGQKQDKDGQDADRDGQLNHEKRINQILDAVSNGCVSQMEIVVYTGIPKGSVANYLNQLYKSGDLIKNEKRQPELPELSRELSGGNYASQN